MGQRTIVAAALGGVLAGGCAAGAGGTTGPATAPGAAVPVTLRAAVQAARADAARRTGLAPEAFELVSAESVTWPDGSLGCPQPGVSYTQALQPGYRVRLRGPAGELDYHGSRGGIAWCPPGRAVDPLAGPGPT